MVQPNVTKIGKYEIQGVIGQGGMGVVYKGVDPRIGRPVAIKMITGGFGNNSDALRRFYREAQSVGNLQHPNIVIVYDLGDEEGRPYLVMEYLEGSPLDKIIAQRSELSLFEKLDIIIQTLRALYYAHQHNVIHRDVKPGNVIVQSNGVCKLVDFGIARGGDVTLTQTGQIIGTMSYMSPEQLNGRSLDQRTDIWSAGVLLYELLTLHLPFEGRDAGAMIVKILNEPPPPLSNYLVNSPSSLDDIMLRALAKDREERYATAEDFAFDLSHIVESLRAQMVSEYVEQARAFMNRSDLSRARELLSRVLKVDTQNTTAKQLLYEVQQLMQHSQRADQVRQLRSQAEEALQQARFDDALTLVDQALRIDKTNLDLLGLREGVLQRKSSKEQIAKKLHLAQAAQKAGELQMALRAVEDALALDSNDTQAKVLASALGREIQQRSQFESLLQGLRTEVTGRRFTAALEMLQKAEAIYPQAPELPPLKSLIAAGREEQERQRRLDSFRKEIEQLLAREQFLQAQIKAEESLRSFPGERALIDLLDKAKANEQRRWVEEQLAAAERMTSEGRITAAITLLETAAAQYPNEPRLASQVPVLRKRAEQQRLANAQTQALARAKDALDRHDHALAIAVLERAQTELGHTSETDHLLSVARAAAVEAARRKQIAEIVQRAQSLFVQGNFDEAEALLAKAIDEGVSDDAVTRLRELAQTKSQEFKLGVERALEKARALLEESKADDALTLLEAQPHLYDRSSDFRLLKDRARIEVNRQRAQALADALVRVRTELSNGNLETASAEIASCRAQFGDSPELTQLAADIEKQRIIWAREAKKRAEQEAQTLVPKKLEPATVIAEPAPTVVLPSGVAAKPVRKAKPTSVGTLAPVAPKPLTPQPAAPQPKPQPQPPTPQPPPKPQPASPRKLLLPIAAAVVCVVGIALYTFLRTPAGAVSVRFVAEQPGTDVSVNGDHCTAPCELKLKPGNYKLNAKLEGYEPLEKDISVGTTPQEVSLQLAPARVAVGSLRVETNVDQVDIHVDGVLKGVTEGKGTVLTLLPGSHEVRAEKRGYAPAVQRVDIGKGTEVKLSFVLNPGTSPEPLRDPYLIVKARPGAKILIDKVAVGTVPADGSFSTQVKPGKHRVEAALSGYKPWSTTLSAKSGESVPVPANLVAEPVSIVAFTATPSNIESGHTAELRWQTQNATEVSIDHGVGSIQPNGSRQITPAASTTYTLIAKSEGQSKQSSVTVTVAVAVPVPVPAPVVAPAKPSILLFESGVDRIQRGQSAKLTWATQNATDVSIDQGVGSVSPSGSREVAPTGSTTYTLTAKGPGGSLTKSVPIRVEAPPPPEPKVTPTAPTAPTAPTTPTTPPRLDAVRETIEQRYKDAYESMVIEELQKVWPTMTKQQKEAINSTFKAYKAIRARYSCSDPTINGDSASCACKETVTYTTKDNKLQPPMSASILFQLKKSGQGWLVQGRSIQ